MEGPKKYTPEEIAEMEKLRIDSDVESQIAYHTGKVLVSNF